MPLPPAPPALPSHDALSTSAREACAGLVYKCLKLTIEGKKKLTSEQRAALGEALDAVIASGCIAFPLAVAVWLRNKKELGNRLISTNLLAACVYREATRPFARAAAKLVIKLPTDLAELNTEYAEVAGSGPSTAKEVRAVAPTCLKKIALDVLDDLPAFQAGKYDSTTKMKRTKAQLKEAKGLLQKLGEPPGEDNGKGGGKGGGKGFGKGGGKGGSDDGSDDGKGYFSMKSNADMETRQRAAKKRVEDLEEKLRKFASGDLRNMLRHTHAGKQHELNVSILRKRYPESQDDFQRSGLPGTFDPERSGARLRVEVPPTWDRELSEKGNVPRTWADLLKAKDDKDRCTLPYMALLRNLRNILLMGLPPSFLRKHVLERLPNRGQIQGSGQTPVSLSHTWAVLEKEFTADKLKDMLQQSKDGIRDIIAYKSLLKKIRAPILGRSDKLPGIIGEFLGEPVWAPCGLKKQNECFLAENRVLIRDGMILDTGKGKDAKGKGKGKGAKGKGAKGKGAKGKGAEGDGKVNKWLPVALHPLTADLLAEFKDAFDNAIHVAASCAVEHMSFTGSGPVVLWMDVSNPPLETDSLGAAKQRSTENVPATDRPNAPLKSVLHLAGLKYDGDFLTTSPGQECELDEITTHRRVVLELRYFASSYIDYNIQGFSSSGENVWNSVFSSPEIPGKDGKPCVVHCRDVAGNPSPTEPALRTIHLDLDNLPDEVFCMVVTSQNFTGNRPEAVSIALRECRSGGAALLRGNHEPHDCNGKLILAQDIGEALKKGGTSMFAALYRDVNETSSWIFRNLLDMSLESETRVAAQAGDAAFQVFKQMFQDNALKSTMNPATIGFVRLCQIYQALTPPAGKDAKCSSDSVKKVDVRIVMTGIKKKAAGPSAEIINLTGKYVDDLNTVRAAKGKFSGKAVDANDSLRLAMDAAGCGDGAVAGLIRIANNAMSPVTELAAVRKRGGRQFPFGTIDARGHILDAFKSLPPVPRAAIVPGQVESAVAILRNMLSSLEKDDGEVDGAELLVRYVDHFLPRDATASVAHEDEDVAS